MVVKNPADALEKDLARFRFKGPGIRKTDTEHFDIMAGEFTPHHAQIESIQATDEEILRIGREARDERLVGTHSGRIARAAGNLSDGSGYLVDMYGNPINRNQNVPVTPMKRKPSDW